VVRKAAIVVVPDPTRFHPLCQELEIETSKPHAVLPNIPIVEPPSEKVNWHDRLGIPRDSIPFLHAGSVDDWAQVPELLSSVPYWPEQAVLVLHSRAWKETEIYRKQLSHLEVPGKVFWSRESLSANALNSLVSYCAGNFALYRNTGPNIEYMGFSSGKLMRSLACGCPVIASKFPSLSFITEYGLGILVNHPAEIPDAVTKIMHEREAYQSRCLDFCSAHASFERAWEKFCEQLRQIVKTDLSRPMS
jgi:glycosyltransferase involved in cell wall biosynthesis